MKIFLLLLILRQFYLIPTGEYFFVVKPKPCHHHGFSDDPVCAEDSFPSGSSSADIRIEQPSIGEPINSCTCFMCPDEVQPVCCCQMFTKIQQGCQGKNINFLGSTSTLSCLTDLNKSCVTLMRCQDLKKWWTR